ncbi:unnamed protein product [Sphagnum tenellum]
MSALCQTGKNNAVRWIFFLSLPKRNTPNASQETQLRGKRGFVKQARERRISRATIARVSVETDSYGAASKEELCVRP